MAWSLRRVRWALVGAGVLLLAVIASFVGYARHRANAYLRGLPARLGVHITQESDDVTYSQSLKGRTIYTVRAAKQIQHEDGRYTLRDVGIVMYGAKGQRADRIHGNEFEWDQKQGVMRAVGEVFIDLGAPISQGDPEKGMIHVKTSGLVFREKEKTAATDELVEFSTGEMSGRSVGASYDSDSGVVVLWTGVRMSGLRGGRPMLLTARRAEMDRVGDVLKLEEAKVVSAAKAGEQSGSAERSVVHLTADGKPKSVEAEGQVVLTEDGGGGRRGTVTAHRLEAELNDAGQVKAARLLGGVGFAEIAASAARQSRGQGAEARIGFDGEGWARSAVLTGGAEVEEQAGKSRRRLDAAKVELALGGGGKDPVVVTGARASGEAQLRLVDANGGKGKTETGVRAEVLTARFAPGAKAKDGAQLTGLDGAGKSRLEQTLRDTGGLVQSKETSAGETLRMEFRPGLEGRSELVRAEQRGGVTVVREARNKAAGTTPPNGRGAEPEVEHAQGDVAVYEKDADRLTMTGGVQLSDGSSSLYADQVVTDRGSGETTALGRVRVSYLQAGSAEEPVHVMATRAISHKTTGITEFFAGAGAGAGAEAKVKMWQGGSQVEAPVLEFDRAKKTIVARDERGADGAVRAVLVDPGKPEAGAKGAAKGSQGPVRVTSREMTYQDAAREVGFRGKVKVDQQDGTMRAETATVYLAPDAAKGDRAVSSQVSGERPGTPANAGVTLGGKVERMVGVGGVEIEQPGRKATGERLVYTAADRTFVLTGTKAVPPKMVDEARGTTTGAALRFRSGEDRVEVSGTGEGDVRRVRTETKVK